MVKTNKEIYEWLRDEFNAGNVPCWFGDSYPLVWAAMKHAQTLESELKKMQGKKPSDDQLASQAYSAYAEALDYRDYNRVPMDDWDNLQENERDAWIAAIRVITLQEIK